MMNNFINLKRNLKCDFTGLPILKVALLGDTATQFLGMAIRGEGIERKYKIELFEAGFNQIERQIFDSTSDLYGFEPQYTIIFQSTHKLLERFSLMPNNERENFADNQIIFLRNICDSVNNNIIIFNYPEIDDSIFGSYANKVKSSFVYQIRKLNYEIMNLAQKYGKLYICDISSVQNKFGRDYMFDSAIYISTEMILSVNAVPYIASRVMDIICSIEGKFKKCLILDLDNTIWGGVVGDDGWENIQLGHGIGIGKAFTEFQEWVKKLKERGIIICICSKNDEDKAKETFINNPEMILKLEDISVFVVNWDNKADNIRTIKRILNISYTSFQLLKNK